LYNIHSNKQVTKIIKAINNAAISNPVAGCMNTPGDSLRLPAGKIIKSGIFLIQLLFPGLTVVLPGYVFTRHWLYLTSKCLFLFSP